MEEEEMVVGDEEKKVGKKYVLGISLLQQSRPKLSRARRGDEHQPIAHCHKNQIFVFVIQILYLYLY